MEAKGFEMATYRIEHANPPEAASVGDEGGRRDSYMVAEPDRSESTPTNRAGHANGSATGPEASTSASSTLVETVHLTSLEQARRY
eukprot:6208640-Pleurochrysis_carterae.AAC.4